MLNIVVNAAFSSALVAAVPLDSQISEDKTLFVPNKFRGISLDGNDAKLSVPALLQKLEATLQVKDVVMETPRLRNTIQFADTGKISSGFDPSEELGHLENSILPAADPRGLSASGFSKVVDGRKLSKEGYNFNGCEGNYPVINTSFSGIDFEILVNDCYYGTTDCPSQYNVDLGCWQTSEVTDMSYAFLGLSNFKEDISFWNTGKVTGMKGMFERANKFNQDISYWDVSAVTDMSRMFDDAFEFNQPIGVWDVSSVTTMNQMFSNAYGFNQPLDNWAVGKVEDMEEMFYSLNHIVDFNQCLSSWASKVPDNVVTTQMFYGSLCSGTNNPQPDTTPWCQTAADGCDQGCGGNYPVINVSGTDFQNLVFRCTSFVQGFVFCPSPYNGMPLGCWETSRVTDMGQAFQYFIFNEDISFWNTTQVTNMNRMFALPNVFFNQDISYWDVSAVANMYRMFEFSVFNKPIGVWDVSSVTNMAFMFRSAYFFNQPLDNWDVGKVETMQSMFAAAPEFNQCLSSWANKVPDNVNLGNIFAYFDSQSSGCTVTQPDPQADISPWCQTVEDGCPALKLATESPTESPSSTPSRTPSAVPSSTPSTSPSAGPSAAPSALPSSTPSRTPSAVPSSTPSTSPSAGPSAAPSTLPSAVPSSSPTALPSAAPTTFPSRSPTESPTGSPTESCDNNPGTFKFQGGKVSCVDLLSLDESDFNDRCKKSKYLGNCPENCNPRCATQSPTARPSNIPSAAPSISCENNPGTFKFKGVKVSCVGLLSLDESDFNNRCKKSKYVNNCPANCNPLCATQIPTASPSIIPSALPSISCENNPGTFKFQGAKVSCADLLSLDESELNETCKRSKYFNNCPTNCNLQCVDCENNQQPFFSNGSLTTCKDIAALDQGDRTEQCEDLRVKDNCPGVCQSTFCPLV